MSFGMVRDNLAVSLRHKKRAARKSPPYLLLYRADIFAREASAMALARKHRCSYKIVLALAHDLLQCTRFLPTWKQPLTSYLPSLPDAPLKKQVAQ